MGGATSNPLLSTVFTLYLLILLYFPHFFLLKLIVSPLFISTLLLLLSLLRLGASQQFQGQSTHDCRIESKIEEKDVLSFSLEIQPARTPEHRLRTKSEPSPEIAYLGPSGNETQPETGSHEISHKEEEIHELDPIYYPKSYRADSFVEWDVRGAPLEIIYEMYDGEENDDEQDDKPGSEMCPLLARYFPESDTDTGSNSSCSSIGDDFVEIWDDNEEEKEGMLFEIAIDDHGYIENDSIVTKKFIKDIEEEDNLIVIEIDIC